MIKSTWKPSAFIVPASSVLDMLIRPSPPLSAWSYDQGETKRLFAPFFFPFPTIQVVLTCRLAVPVLCKPFLGPCRRLSSVGSRATEDLQGTALVQLLAVRPPNGGYLGQMGVAKGGSCLSACGFASHENRCDAPRTCRYWLTSAHRYLGILNRPAVYMQVESRNSHQAPYLRVCGVSRTPEPPPSVKQHTSDTQKKGVPRVTMRWRSCHAAQGHLRTA